MRLADFVEETTTSIAGTNGDGTVTLTAVTGRPRFQTYFGSVATPVVYVIEDTTNGKFERGIGTVTGGSLARDTATVSWDGTTLSQGNVGSSATKIQFGATPTSGNVRVRIAASAGSMPAMLPGLNTSVTGDATWRDYPITHDQNWSNAGAGRTAMTAGTEYYWLYYQSHPGVLSGVQLQVTTAVASGAIKAALYPCAQSGLPGPKIVDFNVLDAATTGVKTDTTTGTWTPAGTPWLSAGWYYIGILPNVAAALQGHTSGTIYSQRTPLGRADAYGHGRGLSVAGNYTTGLPTNPSPTTIQSAAALTGGAWLGLRVRP